MADGTLGRRTAHELFAELFQSGQDPEELVKKKGLAQVSDRGAIAALAAEVIADHPEEAEKLRQGQVKILSFLVGQIMRRSKGTADPKAAGQALSELIETRP
jgi:aspartyl-tRNA(Asn)/glutamyl-tRNA(Gln) amidotransferase subunit B